MEDDFRELDRKRVLLNLGKTVPDFRPGIAAIGGTEDAALAGEKDDFRVDGMFGNPLNPRVRQTRIRNLIRDAAVAGTVKAADIAPDIQQVPIVTAAENRLNPAPTPRSDASPADRKRSGEKTKRKKKEKQREKSVHSG